MHIVHSIEFVYEKSQTNVWSENLNICAFEPINLEDLRDWLDADEDYVGHYNSTLEGSWMNFNYKNEAQSEEVGDNSDDEDDHDNLPTSTLFQDAGRSGRTY